MAGFDAGTAWMVASALIGIMVTIFGWLFSYFWRSAKARNETIFSKIDKNDADIDAVNKELGAFKVRVAEKYISSDRFNTLEKNMLDAIRELGKKVDTLVMFNKPKDNN